MEDDGYDLTKEAVTQIMMLYKNTKAMFHSPDGDTDFFKIVTGVLKGNTLVPYLFIICLDCILSMSIHLIKENCFALKQTIFHRNYDRCR